MSHALAALAALGGTLLGVLVGGLALRGLLAATAAGLRRHPRPRHGG
jgi:hypothetical protein